MLKEQVAQRIKEIRLHKGLSQEKLAFKAELDRTYLAGIESGKRNPTIDSLEKVLNALDVSAEVFFDFSNVDYK